MRKLRLNLDRLVVDSFPTLAHSETPRGTVRGRADTEFCESVSCAYTQLVTCTGCGAVSNSGCAANTEFCVFDSINLCDEHAINRTAAC
jgi:hypothetical protein